MAFLQPATANYFGFQPAKEVSGGGQTNYYSVSSSEASSIYPGDICTMTSINTAKIALPTAAVAACIGVSASYVVAGGGSTNRTATNGCLIYDDPMQVYAVSDSSSGCVGSSGIGLTYFAVSATGVVGSAGPSTSLLRSVMAISGAVQASSAGIVKIIALHPVENNVFGTAATGAASVRKYLVRLDSNIFNSGVTADLLTT